MPAHRALVRGRTGRRRRRGPTSRGREGDAAHTLCDAAQQPSPHVGADSPRLVSTRGVSVISAAIAEPGTVMLPSPPGTRRGASARRPASASGTSHRRGLCRRVSHPARSARRMSALDSATDRFIAVRARSSWVRVMASTVELPETGRLHPSTGTMASSTGALVSMNTSATSGRRLPDEWLARWSSIAPHDTTTTKRPWFLAYRAASMPAAFRPEWLYTMMQSPLFRGA